MTAVISSEAFTPRALYRLSRTNSLAWESLHVTHTEEAKTA